MFSKEREIETLKREAAAEQERNEVTSQQMARMEADLTASKKKLDVLLEKQDSTRRQYSILTRTLQESEAQLNRLNTVRVGWGLHIYVWDVMRYNQGR